MFARHFLERQRLALFLRVLFSFALLCRVLVTPSSGADYYIDSVDGSDINDGLSISTPWMSHVKAETAPLLAGDVVHFKKGICLFRKYFDQ